MHSIRSTSTVENPTKHSSENTSGKSKAAVLALLRTPEPMAMQADGRYRENTQGSFVAEKRESSRQVLPPPNRRFSVERNELQSSQHNQFSSSESLAKRPRYLSQREERSISPFTRSTENVSSRFGSRKLTPLVLDAGARLELTKKIENTWQTYYHKYYSCVATNPEIVLEMQKEYLRSYKGFFEEDPHFELYYLKVAKPEDLREALTLRINRGSPGPDPESGSGRNPGRHSRSPFRRNRSPRRRSPSPVARYASTRRRSRSPRRRSPSRKRRLSTSPQRKESFRRKESPRRKSSPRRRESPRRKESSRRRDSNRRRDSPRRKGSPQTQRKDSPQRRPHSLSGRPQSPSNNIHTSYPKTLHSPEIKSYTQPQSPGAMALQASVSNKSTKVEDLLIKKAQSSLSDKNMAVLRHIVEDAAVQRNMFTKDGRSASGFPSSDVQAKEAEEVKRIAAELLTSAQNLSESRKNVAAQKLNKAPQHHEPNVEVLSDSDVEMIGSQSENPKSSSKISTTIADRETGKVEAVTAKAKTSDRNIEERFPVSPKLGQSFTAAKEDRFQERDVQKQVQRSENDAVITSTTSDFPRQHQKAQAQLDASKAGSVLGRLGPRRRTDKELDPNKSQDRSRSKTSISSQRKSSPHNRNRWSTSEKQARNEIRRKDERRSPGSRSSRSQHSDSFKNAKSDSMSTVREL